MSRPLNDNGGHHELDCITEDDGSFCGLCSCGAASGLLPTMGGVRTWHRVHLDGALGDEALKRTSGR